MVGGTKIPGWSIRNVLASTGESRLLSKSTESYLLSAECVSFFDVTNWNNVYMLIALHRRS